SRHNDSREARHRLLENFETLCVQFCLKEGRPRNVATRFREAGDHAGRYSIADMRDDYRGPGRRPFCCQRRWRSFRDDQVDLDPNKLGGKGWQTLIVPVRVPINEGDVPGFHIAVLPEALSQSLEQARERRCRPAPKEANPPDLPRLRLGGEWGTEGTSQRGQQEAAAGHAGIGGRFNLL